MKTKLALLVIAIFTYCAYYILNLIGIGEHHTDIVWAAASSIVFLTILLVDVWVFFAIAGEEAYKWNI
jgi:hypothetical protein